MGWKGSLLEGPIWAIGRLCRSGFDPLRQTPREILVLRPNDLGDLLTSTPIFAALRERFPSTRIIAGVGRWGRPVVEHNPYVDEIVDIDAPWNNKFVADRSLPSVIRYIWRSQQVRDLRGRNGFDVGIDVLGSHVGTLLMLRVGVRYRIGVRGYRGGWSGCHAHIRFTPKVHVARAALAQAELLGCSVLPEARPQLYVTQAERGEAAQLWRAAPGCSRAPVRLLVGCAAGDSAKSWAPEPLGRALGEIARALAREERPVDIIVVGSAADEVRSAQVVACVAGCVAGAGIDARVRSMAGQTPLRITFALTEQADVVLTNPSMLLHVAGAFRRPTVAILGGTFADALAHDTVWGYPPPYRSVAPREIVPGAHAENWPSLEQVVEEVLQACGCPPTGQTERVSGDAGRATVSGLA